ncbi:response regulator [Lacrimispora brassicae]
MYNVILVDDDIEILEYIEHLLDWEKLEFCVRATATNGASALKLIGEIRPDLLITDITMPGITGLELVRCAKGENTSLKSIIMTCHESFHYAQEALELGVQDYLVKYMLDQAQLEKCVIKIKDTLDKEQQANQYIQKQKRIILNNAKAQITQLLKDMIRSSDSEEFLIRKRLGESELSSLGEFHVIGFCIDNWEIIRDIVPINDLKLLQFAVVNIINELVSADEAFSKHATKAYTISEDMVVVLLKQQLKKDASKKHLMKILDIIRRKILEVLKIDIACVISSCYTDIGKFKNIYECMLNMRLCYFYPDASRIIWNLDNMGSAKSKEHSNLSYEFIDAVHALDYSAIMEQIDKIYSGFYLNHMVPEKMIRYFHNIVHFLESELREQGIEMKLLESKLLTANTYDGYRILTQQAVNCFLEATSGKKKEILRKEIDFVQGYLNTHLQENITCEGMAQIVNMNSSYFSKLFKKETGESFSDYLMRIRIERATMLLCHSDLSMEDITSAIGLSNMHYFYRLYKKQTGETPGRVRRMKRG